ncbi:MAG: aminotransferase class III-fold pyridoxal phosphate-dependent enzyme [Xanthomonadaceae bacterium]|nr:aminotransferase class III-fold pyridoxal phosphate-dependent enzyme [Xanthomonadaceae bacterium]
MPALQPTYAPYPFALVSAHGDAVVAEDGRAFTDFYGGHCVCSTGHSHPRVVDAICAQARSLLFYSTAAELPVRTAAADALVRYAGPHIASVFFCNSGAEANENALKLSAQLTGRSRFVAFAGGFHGRTLLALACTDLPKLHAPLRPLLPACEFLPFGDAAALAQADFSEVAAVIVEPIQSMAGVRTADPSWFTALQRKCTDAGTMLVVDEVQTGFGRTGTPFAFHQYDLAPDFVTCAKGIASGFPLGAVLFAAPVAAQIAPGDLGSTFGGGPVASAALLATLEVIEEEGLAARALAAEARIRAGVEGTVVTEVRGAGLLIGLVVGGGHAAALKAHLQAERVLVGASADPEVLRLMPPLNVSDAAIDHLLHAVRSFAPAGAA